MKILAFVVKTSDGCLSAYIFLLRVDQLWRKVTFRPFRLTRGERMISLGSNGKESSELLELMKKFPTSAFVAGRLHEVGWGSDYGRSLLDHFSEELLQVCGKELSGVLEHFRALKPSSR